MVLTRDRFCDKIYYYQSGKIVCEKGLDRNIQGEGNEFMKYYSVEDLESFATLDEHKEHLLEMMDAFDAFCKEHGLRYCLSGGTLLGAIRHKGFIPWDDDVDVNMPRPDCEKLMELSGGKIGKYILNPPNCTTVYHAYHYKLYDESILVGKKKKDSLAAKTYPIFMDIFPIEGLPDTEEGNIRYFEELIAKKELLNEIWYYKKYGGRNPFTARKKDKRIRDNQKRGMQALFDDVVAHQKSISYDDSEYIGVTSTNIHTVEERVRKSDFMTVIDVEFEGRKFPGPKGYDIYLRQLYGDSYMMLPPLNTRVSRHGLIPFHPYFSPGSDIEFDMDAWKKRWCPGKPDIKIAICGLVKSENIGEQFIARSLEYLIATELQKEMPGINIDFTEVDLLARNDLVERIEGGFNKKVVNYSFTQRGRKLDECYEKLKQKRIETDSRLKIKLIDRVRAGIFKHGENYRKRMAEFFDERLSGVDFIVVDGAGLLEYSYNEYEWSLMLISRYAEKHGVDIVYNAIGRAGEFNRHDLGAKVLRRALNSPRVKYISARDSSENVQECAGSKHQVKLLADAAFWMKETYGMEDCPERKKIGIGLIRGNSLTGYGEDYDDDNWVRLFCDIARELEKKGYEYEFFTNGLPGDIALGYRVIGKLGLSGSKLVTKPSCDLELYSKINEYKALITCRMHSSIAAFTLKIPSVILSWNDKVDKLMAIAGYPERAITTDNFNAEYIVGSMEKALTEGVSDECLESMKAKAHESVADYIDLIAEVAKKKGR